MLDEALTRMLGQRPLLLVLAGPNGAGKRTFYQTHLTTQGLRFVNADILARELGMDDRQAATAVTSG